MSTSMQQAFEQANRRRNQSTPTNANHSEQVTYWTAWLADRITRGRKEVFSEVVDIPPILASILLQTNASNRPIVQRNIDKMSSDLCEGRFVLNGEPVIISAEGLLNDGQHRLQAVVRAGVSLRTVIVFGVSRESRLTVDQGTARTLGQYFAMQGQKNYNAMAITTTMIWQYQHYGMLLAHNRPTKSQALELLAHNSDIIASVEWGMRARALGGTPIMAFCRWAFLRVADAATVEDFCSRLLGGADLGARSPILYCRKRLLTIKAQKEQNEKAELIFRTWNLDRRGRECTRIVLLGGKLPALEK